MSFTIELFKQILGDKVGIGIADISDDSSLVDDLGVQSIDFAEVMTAIEKRCAIEFWDLALDEVETVAQAYRALADRVARPPRA